MYNKHKPIYAYIPYFNSNPTTDDTKLDRS